MTTHETPSRSALPEPPHGARGAGSVRRSVAALVLALATGLPLRSADRLVPDAEEFGPFLGV